MYQTDKGVVTQVLKVVVIINLIIIDHSRMIQAFRFIEISQYDDGGQLTTRGQLMQGSSKAYKPYWSSECACAATLFTAENVEKQSPRAKKNIL